MFENTSRVKVFTIKFIYNYVYYVVRFLFNLNHRLHDISKVGRNKIPFERAAKQFSKRYLY